MPISFGYQFKCPYCGLECRLYHEVKGNASQVVPIHIKPFIEYCPTDEGGCDKQVAVRLKPLVDCEFRRVEGEYECRCSTGESEVGEEKPPDVDTRQLDLFQNVSPGESESGASPASAPAPASPE